MSKAVYYIDLILMPKSAISGLGNLYFKCLWCRKNKSSVDRRICQIPKDNSRIEIINVEF